MVGVDGADPSLAAVDGAAEEAARHGVAPRVVHGCRWERYERIKPSFGLERSAGRILAENIVAIAAERAEARFPDVKVSAEVTAEDPVHALLEGGRHAFALVVGERGRGGQADSPTGRWVRRV